MEKFECGDCGCYFWVEDRNNFYDDNEEEIENILEDFKDNCGYKNRSEAISNLNGSAEDITQEKNLLSWMAFEETGRIISEEIEELERTETLDEEE